MAYDLSQLVARIPRDKELEDAQSQDASRDNWQRVSDDLYSAFTRSPYQKTDTGPGEAAKLLQARDAGTKRLESAATLADIANKLDPESFKAKAYRPVVKSQYDSLGTTPPVDLNTANAGDLADVSAVMDRAERAAKSKGAIAMDDAARKSLVAKGKRLEAAHGVKEEDMEDWDHYPPAKLIDMLRLKEGEYSQQGVADRAAVSAELAKNKGAQTAERITIAKQKLADSELHAAGESQKALPTGYALINPMKPPDPAISREVESLTGLQQQVNSSLDKLQELLARNHGRMLPTDKDYIHYKSIFTTVLGKLVKAEGMGNLTVAHQNLSHEFAQDPAALLSWLNSDLGGEQIQDLKNDVRETLNSYATTHNMRPLARGEAQSPSAYAPAKGIEQAETNVEEMRAKKQGKVKVSVDGQVGYIPADKLDEFTAEHPTAKVLGKSTKAVAQ